MSSSDELLHTTTELSFRLAEQNVALSNKIEQRKNVLIENLSSKYDLIMAYRPLWNVFFDKEYFTDYYETKLLTTEKIKDLYVLPCDSVRDFLQIDSIGKVSFFMKSLKTLPIYRTLSIVSFILNIVCILLTVTVHSLFLLGSFLFVFFAVLSKISSSYYNESFHEFKQKISSLFTKHQTIEEYCFNVFNLSVEELEKRTRILERIIKYFEYKTYIIEQRLEKDKINEEFVYEMSNTNE